MCHICVIYVCHMCVIFKCHMCGSCAAVAKRIPKDQIHTNRNQPRFVDGTDFRGLFGLCTFYTMFHFSHFQQYIHMGFDNLTDRFSGHIFLRNFQWIPEISNFQWFHPNLLSLFKLGNLTIRWPKICSSSLFMLHGLPPTCLVVEDRMKNLRSSTKFIFFKFQGDFSPKFWSSLLLQERDSFTPRNIGNKMNVTYLMIILPGLWFPLPGIQFGQQK